MDVIQGPVWAGRNWAAHAGAGSIHDDATASELGFRGGTVPGDVHMNQFAPVLCQLFGEDWFEHGYLSLNFKNATVDGEPVQVFAERQTDVLARVWMERTDGLLVCQGDAGLGQHQHSTLRTRDLRACDPTELTLLRRLSAGLSLGEYDVTVPTARQYELYDQNLISDPMPIFRQGSRWGASVACPSTLVQQLWGIPMRGLNPYIGDAVGLFGAIEVAQLRGPVLLDHLYHLTSEVVAVGQSPQTEYLWFDTVAHDERGEVASLRMQLRFMKASIQSNS